MLVKAKSFMERIVVVMSNLNLQVLITTAANDIWIVLFFNFSEKTRLGISCESSAEQTIDMKCQILFPLKIQ